MLLYLILTSISLTVFWLYFQLVMRKTTLFKLNRCFLLGAMIFSLAFPFSGQFFASQRMVEVLDENTTDNIPYQETIISAVGEVRNDLQAVSSRVPLTWSWWFVTYLLVGMLLLGRSVYAFVTVKIMSKGASATYDNGLRILTSHRIKEPFSFFRTIYLPQGDNTQLPKSIILHEREHVYQYHFIDLFLAELIVIILWFNPVVYLFKKAVRLNLEYLADEAVVKNGANKVEYQSLLLSHALENNFYNPLTTNFTLPLKNRITMMQKKRSNSWKSLTVIGILPMAILLMAMSTREHLQTNIVKNLGPVNFIIGQNNKPDRSPLNESDITKISSHFGERYDPFLKVKKLHTGIDLTAKSGTAVYATADGEVILSENDDDWGNHIKIKHSDVYETRYGHMSRLIVKTGDVVKKGDLIGYVGNTGKSKGPHLHYEVHVNGRAVDPADFFDLC